MVKLNSRVHISSWENEANLCVSAGTVDKVFITEYRFKLGDQSLARHTNMISTQLFERNRMTDQIVSW